MNLLHCLSREAGLFIRTRSSVAALALLCVLASIAIGLGHAEVQRQEASIERVRALDVTERDYLPFLHELADRSALLSLGGEATEGLTAFTEKREPLWRKGS